VVELASVLRRTPSSVALKLVNFARLDPKLRERNISGMKHGSKAELDLWQEFSGNSETLAYEDEVRLAELRGYRLRNRFELISPNFLQKV
jgi:putative restriction endonuclease